MAAFPSSLRLGVCVGLWLALTGCHAVDYYQDPLQKPVPPAMEPPRDLAKISLPSYRVEPPDMLQIEMLKLVPLPPYRIDIYDVLQIRVLNPIPDQPIEGFFLVEGEGVVTLGPAYGRVRVVGMTIDEATEAITRKLQEMLAKPDVSVQLAKTAGTQPLTGQYLIAPDGTINLRQYGQLRVAGMTVTEIREALRKHMSQYFDSPDATVDVIAYNSKVYYVITEGAGLGDNIRRVPITGNDTVLDALSMVNGLSQVSSTQIWIARPAPGGVGCEQILPVDYDAVARGGLAATNYQILPGDRVFIAEDNVSAFNNYLAKLTMPIERLLGLGSLGASTTRTFQTMGRNYNRTRSGY
ncbi:MAG: polysaccharide biosynthesis/export family protein [Thermoguttaceae bacterium]